MAWVASLLLFLVLGAGAVGFALYRRSINAEDAPVQEVPADVLIALGRANDAALGSREAGQKADTAVETAEGPGQGLWRDGWGETPR